MLLLYVVFGSLLSSLVRCEDVCWRHRTNGNRLDVGLDFQYQPGIQEMLTLRGTYDHTKHTKSGSVESKFNGFYLYNASGIISSQVPPPLLNVFNRATIPKGNNGEKYIEVPSIIRKCCDRAGNHFKNTFPDSLYTRESVGNVYQLILNENDALLAINGRTLIIKKPPTVETFKIRHARQRSEATTFTDVTICPLRISVKILEESSLSEMKSRCEAGLDCENVGTIYRKFGGNVTLGCFASGPPPIDIQWKLNEEDITSDGDIITDVSLSQLSITELDRSRVGVYSCVAHNRFNETIISTGLVNIVGFGPISLFIKPGSMAEITCNEIHDCGESANVAHRLKGEDISLSCKGFGSHPTHLWWTYKGTHIAVDDTYRVQRAQNLSDISFRVTEETAGDYSCHGNYTGFQGTTSNVSVRVIGYDPISLYISQKPISQITCNDSDSCGTTVDNQHTARVMGENISFSCKAFGSHPITVWWRVRSADVTGGGVYSVVEAPDASEITFTVSKETANRIYSCHATYADFGQVEKSMDAYLKGFDPISLFMSAGRMSDIACDDVSDCGENTDKIVLMVGEEVSLSCKAFGSDSTYLWWSYEGTNLTDSVLYRINEVPDLTEITFTVTRDRVGQYSCHAAYDDYERTLANLTTSVDGYEPISAFIMPGDLLEIACNESEQCRRTITTIKFERLIGEEMVMSCKAFGSHPTHVWWSRRGENLTNEENYQIRGVENVSELSFKVDTSKEDWYKCTAAYIFDTSITSNVLIEVAGVFPLTVRVLEPKYVVATPGSSVEFTCFIDEYPFKPGMASSWKHVSSKTQTKYLNQATGDEEDEEGRRYGVSILKFENVQESDGGVFSCGRDGVSDMASLFVETVVETPFVNFTRNQDGDLEISCSTRAKPLATLDLEVTAGDDGEKQDLVLVLTRTEGNFLQKTWAVESAEDFYSVNFVCKAAQSSRRKEVSGTIALTRPLRTEINFISSNETELSFRSGESFAIKCTARGSPAPKLLLLIRNGQHVIESIVNENSSLYEIELTATLKNVTIEDQGWYSCVASDNGNISDFTETLEDLRNKSAEHDWVLCKGGLRESVDDFGGSTRNWTINEHGFWHDISSSIDFVPTHLDLTRKEIKEASRWYSCKQSDTESESFADLNRLKVNILHHESLQSLEISFSLDFEEADGVIEIPEGSNPVATCSARGGFPVPDLFIFLNNNILKGQSELSGDVVLIHVMLPVDRDPTMTLKCEAWQDKFGEYVVTKTSEVTLVSNPILPPTEPAPLKSYVLFINDQILVLSYWVAVGLIGLALIFGLILLFIPCCRRRKKEDQIEPLSSSEDERLRTQSIDLAERRMEMLNNLYDHPVSSPCTRITRSMSRSREGLESLRQRQRTRSGDTLDDLDTPDSRHRVQSGDLVQGEQRQRAQTGADIMLDQGRCDERERHTSC